MKEERGDRQQFTDKVNRKFYWYETKTNDVNCFNHYKVVRTENEDKKRKHYNKT